MTGHGTASVEQNGARVGVELKTVNNRYYKLALRITDGFASLESRVDELIRRSVRRGTVQANVRIQVERSNDAYRLNETAILSYLRQAQQIVNQTDGSVELDFASILSLPGVTIDGEDTSEVIETIWPAIESAVNSAVDCLNTMRRREGDAMAIDLAANSELIASSLDRIDELGPRVAESYRTRLCERMNKLLAEFDVKLQASDVIREVGLFSERCDISEEIVRLRSHLSQFSTIMDGAESNGRKLEFITQEMFREANTIGSKANDADIALHVVDIKTAIERIREMIQNVE